jgi:hypothetical protein
MLNVQDALPSAHASEDDRERLAALAERIVALAEAANIIAEAAAPLRALQFDSGTAPEFRALDRAAARLEAARLAAVEEFNAATLVSARPRQH